MARKVKTKKQKIEGMLAKGKSVSEIVDATGASPAYVYKVRTDVGIKAVRALSHVPPTGIAAITRSDIQPGILYEAELVEPSKKSLWQRVKEFLC